MLFLNRQVERVGGVFRPLMKQLGGTILSLIATDKSHADLVSDLSEAFSIFSNEAAKLSALLARSEAPVSPESYNVLRKQCVAEVQAFEEYLNRKEEIFAFLKVESRHA
jgi:hypothetical protein